MGSELYKRDGRYGSCTSKVLEVNVGGEKTNYISSSVCNGRLGL